jgi:hypothetical protein
MIAGHLGVMPERSHAAYVAFSPEDAKRRFISENPSLWADIEADLKLQLVAQNDRLACRRAGARGAWSI